MEFGRVAEHDLNNIDFSLPIEPAFNKTILSGGPNKSAKVYVGCAKWGREEWVGKIYPPKTKDKEFLQHYVQHYNSIELNATHYKVYDEIAINKWAEKVKGKQFLFCPKMYKSITHFGILKEIENITDEFLNGIMAFGKHLEPVFIHFSEIFSLK